MSDISFFANIHRKGGSSFVNWSEWMWSANGEGDTTVVANPETSKGYSYTNSSPTSNYGGYLNLDFSGIMTTLKVICFLTIILPIIALIIKCISRCADPITIKEHSFQVFPRLRLSDEVKMKIQRIVEVMNNSISANRDDVSGIQSIVRKGEFFVLKLTCPNGTGSTFMFKWNLNPSPTAHYTEQFTAEWMAKAPDSLKWKIRSSADLKLNVKIDGVMTPITLFVEEIDDRHTIPAEPVQGFIHGAPDEVNAPLVERAVAAALARYSQA